MLPAAESPSAQHAHALTVPVQVVATACSSFLPVSGNEVQVNKLGIDNANLWC